MSFLNFDSIPKIPESAKKIMWKHSAPFRTPEKATDLHRAKRIREITRQQR